MIHIEQNELKPPTFLDPSNYAIWKRCEAKYAFRNLLGLTSPGGKIALDYGSAIHCAMPFLQRGMLPEAIKAFGASWSADLAKGTFEEDSKRNVSCATQMIMKWYVERFKAGAIPYEIIEPLSTGVEPSERYSDQEFAFSVDMSAEDGPVCLPFCGRCDGLSRCKSTGGTWPVEYKTTSELSNRFTSSFSLNSQLIGYATAVSLLQGQNVEGVFLEALRVTSKDQMNLCVPVRVEPHKIEAFIESFQKTSGEILEATRTGTFDQDFSACAPYAQFGSHGYQCEFAILCGSPDWRSMLDAFVVDFWCPFKEEEKDVS